ncbi:MAG: D-hexose-6-phosphate mutarotase [Azovibrio sp.]|uniref:D-hexose-6-phosphate mutarotase n=1 Tax=Azovibrio sp. TaxID=1872673 RepID=UPI003C749A24
MAAMIDFNGTPACRLTLPDGSAAVIARKGAQLLSWNPRGKGERIYLSPLADPAQDRPVRGGVPVIFPQFAGMGPLPRHGFARTAQWQLDDIRQAPDGAYTSATFSLEDDETSRTIWPHAFCTELTLCISDNRLDMELEVRNTGNTAFAFTAALHTYLKVQELEECHLTGLYGASYTDRISGQQALDRAPELTVEDEIDRIYHALGRPLLLSEAKRALAIHQEGFPDVVIWNPWEHKCAALDDMPAKGFRHMLCIEAAAVTQAVELPPGANWFGRQSLICL